MRIAADISARMPTNQPGADLDARSAGRSLNHRDVGSQIQRPWKAIYGTAFNWVWLIMMRTSLAVVEIMPGVQGLPCPCLSATA